jgi:hypothetical protein
MSLNYYLFCREKYCYILNYFNSINELHNEAINIIQNSQENNYDIFLMEYSNKSLDIIKENILELKNLCDKRIIEICEHEFENDLIDITPDRSEIVTYCKVCGFTK